MLSVTARQRAHVSLGAPAQPSRVRMNIPLTRSSKSVQSRSATQRGCKEAVMNRVLLGCVLAAASLTVAAGAQEQVSALAALHGYSDAQISALVRLADAPDVLTQIARDPNALAAPAAAVPSERPDLRAAVEQLADAPELLLFAAEQPEKLAALKEQWAASPSAATDQLRQIRARFAGERQAAESRWAQLLSQAGLTRAYADVVTKLAQAELQRDSRFPSVAVLDERYYLACPPDSAVMQFAIQSNDSGASDALKRLLEQYWGEHGLRAQDDRVLAGQTPPVPGFSATRPAPPPIRPGSDLASAVGLMPEFLLPPADQSPSVRRIAASFELARLWGPPPGAAQSPQNASDASGDVAATQQSTIPYESIPVEQLAEETIALTPRILDSPEGHSPPGDAPLGNPGASSWPAAISDAQPPDIGFQQPGDTEIVHVEEYAAPALLEPAPLVVPYASHAYSYYPYPAYTYAYAVTHTLPYYYPSYTYYPACRPSYYGGSSFYFGFSYRDRDCRPSYWRNYGYYYPGAPCYDGYRSGYLRISVGDRDYGRHDHYRHSGHYGYSSGGSVSIRGGSFDRDGRRNVDFDRGDARISREPSGRAPSNVFDPVVRSNVRSTDQRRVDSPLNRTGVSKQQGTINSIFGTRSQRSATAAPVPNARPAAPRQITRSSSAGGDRGAQAAPRSARTGVSRAAPQPRSSAPRQSISRSAPSRPSGDRVRSSGSGGGVQRTPRSAPSSRQGASRSGGSSAGSRSSGIQRRPR